VNFVGRFDAGVLVVYQDPDTWAKLCLELSPLNKLMIVSVVTKGVSDDCNSYLVEGKSAYLRLSRLERAFAFHASPDGENWNLIRHFSLGSIQDLKMGFLAQAPRGPGCRVSFDQIQFEKHLLEDIRSGE
jgi:regulation of enolase protein 1 (concanavalin A-like superfamily)